MKRRDFLMTTSAGLAGTTLPRWGFGAVKPCPPPTVSVDGGAPVSTPCGGSVTQASDWLARSTGPGVVWAHNFEYASEVSQFRNSNNYGIDPSGQNATNVTWVSTDGFAGGGCVQVNVPSGSTTGDAWWRPFSALKAGQPGSSGGVGNGLPYNDPAANGTLSVNSYDSSAPSVNYNWQRGYYANAAIQTEFPYWPDPGNTGVYDGTDFYIQMRIKIQSTRWAAGNPSGKLLFIDTTGLTGTQEVLCRSVNNPDSITGNSWGGGTQPWLMYTSQGNEPNSVIMANGQGAYAGEWENGPYAATCTVGNQAAAGACWNFPNQQWFTVLIHVIPGQDNDAYYGANPSSPLSSWPHHDTGIEVWTANPGQTSYQQVFSNLTLAWDYYTTPQSSGDGPNGQYHPPAFNSLAPSAYMNGVNSVTGWYQRYTQIIFSKSVIPCPQV
jgi:hypothetical protein